MDGRGRPACASPLHAGAGQKIDWIEVRVMSPSQTITNQAAGHTVLVVAGMHRSGTSALSKVLSAHGYALPKTLLAASSANEAGFYESVPINRLNDKIMWSLAKTTWQSWRAMPANWQHAPEIDALKKEAVATLEAEFDLTQSFLLKDPRLCRLMPFWQEVLDSCGLTQVHVCPIRNPLEVAASLERRNGLPVAQSLLLWLRYQLDAELYTRDRPRAFTHFNDLLTDWHQVIKRIDRATGLRSSAYDQSVSDLPSWVDVELRHHTVPDATALHDASCPEWVRAAYAIFMKWSYSCEDRKDFAQLDRLREELNSIPGSLMGILDTGQRNIDENRSLKKKFELLESNHKSLSDKASHSELNAAFANDQLDEARRELTATKQALVETARGLGKHEEAARLSGDRLVEIRAELCDKERTLIESIRLLGERDSALKLTESQLQKTRLELDTAQQMLAEAGRQLVERDAAVRLSEERLQEIRAELGDKERALIASLKLLGERDSTQQLTDSQLQQTRQELDAAKQKLWEIGRHLGERDAANKLLNEQFQAARVELGKAQMELASASGRRAELETRLDKATNQVNELQKRIDTLQEERIPLDQRLARLETDFADKNRDAGVLKKKLFDARDKLASTTQSLDAAQQELELLKSELGKIKSSVVWWVVTAPKKQLQRIRGLLSRRPGSVEREKIALIAASELFDRDWYRDQNPDVADAGHDPAQHYYRSGARELRDPGPRFNTRFYLEKHPDVAASNINPLLHYELFGRQECREIAPAKRALPAPADVYRPVSRTYGQITLAADHQPVRWNRFSVMPQPAEGLTVELVGQRLGWLPVTEKQDKAMPAVLAGSLVAFAKLMGQPVADGIRLLQAGASGSVSARQLPAQDGLDLSILAFPDSGLTIESAWYLNERDMRLRFSTSGQGASVPHVVRFFQCDPLRGGFLALVGEHLLYGHEMAFADLCLINSYLPVLATLSQPDACLVSATLLPYPSLCQGGAHFPELLATGDKANSMESLREVSLQLLHAHMAVLRGQTRPELGNIEVGLCGARGTERVFSRDFKEWLLTVMQVGLKAATEPDPADQAYWNEALDVSPALKVKAPRAGVEERERVARLSMVCPPNAIPSIHALVAGQADGGFSNVCSPRSWVVADAASGEARWRIDMPSFASGGQCAQAGSMAVGYPFVRPEGDKATQAAAPGPEGRAPIAVLECDFRPPHPGTLILPVAPEIPGPLIDYVEQEGRNGREGLDSIHCVYVCERHEPRDFSAFLESLRLQQHVELESLFIAFYPGQESDRQSIESALQRFYPGRFQLIEIAGGKMDVATWSRFDALLPESGVMLWVAQDVVLHDPRTLETLWRVALQEKVASAGCMLLRTDSADKNRPVVFSSAGMIPVSEQFSPDWSCREIDSLPIFSRSTYPVAANAGAFFVARADIWKSLVKSAFSETGDLIAETDYHSLALRQGYRHFCTTLVSAEQLGADAQRWTPPAAMQAMIRAASLQIEVLRP